MARSNNYITNGDRAEKGLKKGYLTFFVLVVSVTLLFLLCVPVFASPVPGASGSGSTDPIAVVNNLSEFIFGLIRAVGLILLGFGIVQLGLSLKSHDPSQRANGIMTVTGGIIITFAKDIMNLIVK